MARISNNSRHCGYQWELDGIENLGKLSGSENTGQHARDELGRVRLLVDDFPHTGMRLQFLFGWTLAIWRSRLPNSRFLWFLNLILNGINATEQQFIR